MTGDASLVAAREHTLTSRNLPVRAHVIVTHDLNSRVHQVMDLFSIANRCEPGLLEDVTRSLLNDILRDCNTLQAELHGIERWAQRQLDKLATSIRDND